MYNIVVFFVFLSVAAYGHRHDKEWKYMVFTQTWAPASCAQIEKQMHKHCIHSLTSNKWTIHGIWPNNDDKTGPFFCNDDWKFNEHAISDIEKDLDEHWPNLIDSTPHTKFWKHEWDKHGTCAASLPALNSEHKYFAKGLEFNREWNLTKILESSEITPSHSNSYSLSAIKETIEDASNSLVNVGCIKVDGHQYLTQVEICMDKHFDTIDCDDSYSNKRGKIVFKPTLKSIYPCHTDQPVYYLKI